MGTITANFIKPRALINLLLQISSERGTRDYPRRGRQQAAACPLPPPGPGPRAPALPPRRAPVPAERAPQRRRLLHRRCRARGSGGRGGARGAYRPRGGGEHLRAARRPEQRGRESAGARRQTPGPRPGVGPSARGHRLRRESRTPPLPVGRYRALPFGLSSCSATFLQAGALS